MDEDGYVYIVDARRHDHQRRFNVYCAEWKRDHGAAQVREAVVIGVPDESGRGGESDRCHEGWRISK